MLVCVFAKCIFAHETAGAARTRSSLRPLFFWGRMNLQTSGECCRENAEVRPRTTSPPSSSANGSAEWPPDDRLRRTIQYSETLVMERKTRDVLDARLRGHDGDRWSVAISVIARST